MNFPLKLPAIYHRHRYGIKSSLLGACESVCVCGRCRTDRTDDEFNLYENSSDFRCGPTVVQFPSVQDAARAGDRCGIVTGADSKVIVFSSQPVSAAFPHEHTSSALTPHLHWKFVGGNPDKNTLRQYITTYSPRGAVNCARACASA